MLGELLGDQPSPAPGSGPTCSPRAGRGQAWPPGLVHVSQEQRNCCREAALSQSRAGSCPPWQWGPGRLMSGSSTVPPARSRRERPWPGSTMQSCRQPVRGSGMPRTSLSGSRTRPCGAAPALGSLGWCMGGWVLWAGPRGVCGDLPKAPTWGWSPEAQLHRATRDMGWVLSPSGHHKQLP